MRQALLFERRDGQYHEIVLLVLFTGTNRACEAQLAANLERVRLSWLPSCLVLA
jgi:hypothetical protein